MEEKENGKKGLELKLLSSLRDAAPFKVSVATGLVWLCTQLDTRPPDQCTGHQSFENEGFSRDFCSLTSLGTRLGEFYGPTGPGSSSQALVRSI
ncbi:unnamed protein product [Calypogeia fissa]